MNSSARRLRMLSLVLALSPLAAHAIGLDAKKLALFDLSYAQCEAQFPQMKGQRDQAYLSLWRAPADKRALSDLAKLRKRVDYRDERERALKAAPNGVLAASSPLADQCQALWAEAQKMKKPAAAKKP